MALLSAFGVAVSASFVRYRVKIQHRILGLQLVVAGIVIMMAAVAFVSHRYSDYYLRRVEWTNYQLNAITSVSLHANDYIKQIVELLLLGDPEGSNFHRSADDLASEIEDTRKLTLNEHAFLLRMGETSDIAEELSRLDRIDELLTQMNAAVADMTRLVENQRHDEAVLLFRRRIERELGAEFDHILRKAVSHEQQKVAQAEKRADDAWARIIWVTLITAFIALVACLITAQRLATSLLRPIHHLIVGIEAVGRGDLSGHIDEQGNDELTQLARGFNRMSAQLKEQRLLVERARHDLERQVEDRTAKLAMANRRLSDLDRQRVQFFADVSHELRTPLTALRGEAEITLRRPPESQAAYLEVLTRIVELTGDMKRLVDDLLFLARTEGEALRFELECVALAPLVKKLGHEGKVLGRDKHIDVGVHLDPTPARVNVDPRRLRQALLIILDNAIKYSPAEHRVTLVLTVRDQQASICVRDQGHGIRSEDLPHVFDRFYRSMRSDGDGLGLGLPIAKRLVEKQQGRIDIDSVPGRYTEVCITLPLCTDCLPDNASAPPGHEERRPGSQQGSD